MVLHNMVFHTFDISQFDWHPAHNIMTVKLDVNLCNQINDMKGFYVIGKIHTVFFARCAASADQKTVIQLVRGKLAIQDHLVWSYCSENVMIDRNLWCALIGKK